MTNILEEFKKNELQTNEQPIHEVNFNNPSRNVRNFCILYEIQKGKEIDEVLANTKGNFDLFNKVNTLNYCYIFYNQKYVFVIGSLKVANKSLRSDFAFNKFFPNVMGLNKIEVQCLSQPAFTQYVLVSIQHYELHQNLAPKVS